MYTNNPIKPYKTWTTTIKEDPIHGTYIELPPELLETLGWTEGTQFPVVRNGSLWQHRGAPRSYPRESIRRTDTFGNSRIFGNRNK